MPSVAYWIPSRCFEPSIKDIVDHNSKRIERYANLTQWLAAAQAALAGAAATAGLEATDALKDEGMALVAQMVLMSECDAFIGSYASSVGILVHDLMHARRVAGSARLHAIDVNGRGYCGCGASF